MRTILNKYRVRSSSEGGFSLIELIVAISILLILSTALLLNYNSMNTRLTLDTLAHQTAQWVRATQVLAMSVKQTTGANKFPGYGLHFDRSTPDQFVFFADFGDGAGGLPNKLYDPPTGAEKCGDPGVECQEVINLQRGNKITKLCMPATGTSAVVDCGAYHFASILDFVFTRPDPDANITGKDASGFSSISFGRITVAAPSGYVRTVEVWTTGQVSVQ